MKGYSLSGEADRDIEGIARHSAERWGWERAEAYLTDLHDAFDLLAGFPRLGRAIDHIRPGIRRFEHGSHTIFYRVTALGILVVRVLHGQMRPDERL